MRNSFKSYMLHRYFAILWPQSWITEHNAATSALSWYFSPYRDRLRVLSRRQVAPEKDFEYSKIRQFVIQAPQMYRFAFYLSIASTTRIANYRASIVTTIFCDPSMYDIYAGIKSWSTKKHKQVFWDIFNVTSLSYFISNLFSKISNLNLYHVVFCVLSPSTQYR